MCGRYENRYDPRKLALRYGFKIPNLDYYPPAEFAPTMTAPVIILNGKEPELRFMKWGLIPSWAKDPKIGSKCFNAKSETAADKPAFRSAYKLRRCLVPVTSFFEWREELEPAKLTTFERQERRDMGLLTAPVPSKKIKKKYKFTVPEEKIFSLAGLWEIWKQPQGEVVESFTVLTTSPNELLSQYHNRMPVILRPDTEGLWLRREEFPEWILGGPFVPFPASRMAVEAVQ